MTKSKILAICFAMVIVAMVVDHYISEHRHIAETQLQVDNEFDAKQLMELPECPEGTTIEALWDRSKGLNCKITWKKDSVRLKLIDQRAN